MAERSKTRACDECRQQKLRCEMPRGRTGSCVRCTRAGIACVSQGLFQRKKRRSKAEMQREIDELKQLASADPRQSRGSEHVPPMAMPTRATPSDRSESLQMRVTDPTVSEVVNPLTFSTSEFMTRTAPSRQTEGRVLDGFVMDPRKINDCVDLYFQHYHEYLPIMDSSFTPNQYYEYSPLLFWAMVVTGSRRYAEDPTLLSNVGPKVCAMALQSLASLDQYVQLIQALLVLSNWPVPIDTIFKDSSPVFCGVAMQLALQHSFHLSETRQAIGFQQMRSEGDAEATRIGSMRCNDHTLWTYCRIVCLSISVCYGIEPQTVQDSSHGIFTNISLTASSSKADIRLHDLWITAMKTLIRHPLQHTSSSNVPIGPLVKVFDGQLCQLAAQDDPKPHHLKVLMARVHVGSFHFFDQGDARQPHELIKVYQIACSFIEALSEGGPAANFLLYSPLINYRTMVLAAFIILRTLRSTLRDMIGVQRAESAYLSTINILKRRSLLSNDLEARNAVILQMLWDSHTALRKSDGTYDGLRMRSTTRGSFSVAFDPYWYWIRELHNRTTESDMLNRSTGMNGAQQKVDIIPMASTEMIPPLPAPSYEVDMFASSEATLAELFGESFDAWNSMNDFDSLL